MASRSAIWGEAFATMRSTPAASVAVIAVTFAVGFLAAFGGIEDVRRIVTAWDRKVAAGSAVLAVTSPSPNGLPSARCEQLNSLDSVVTAGGRHASSSATSALLPSQRFQVDVATPHYARVIWPGLSENADTSVVASSAVAAALGLGAGSAVVAQAGPAPYLVTSVASQTPRIPQLQNSLVVSSATASSVEACLVEAAPSAATEVEALLTGWFSGPDPVSVLRLNPPREADQDPQEELTRRISLAVPLAAGIGVAALACILLWARRNDFATYLLSCATRREALDLFLIEFAYLYAVPLAGGVLAQLAARTPDLAASTVTLHALLLDSAALMVAASTAIPIARAYLRRLDPITTLKGE